jgi:5-methylthioadenosine/S-adenosylhomocysteine deaminase
LFDRLRTAGPNDRILLKGTIVISVDLAIGDFDQGDVLIRGRRIEAVDADLSAVAADGGAIVIEMGGMIVMLGIIDGHRHCWQNQFRRAIPDVDLAE